MGWDADTHRSIRLEGACSRNRRHRQISNSQFTYWLFWTWCLWAWSDSACMAAYTAQSDTVTPSAASRCDHMLCRPGWKHSPEASEIWAGRCSPWNSHVSHFYLNPTFDQDSLSSWISTLIWKHITVFGGRIGQPSCPESQKVCTSEMASSCEAMKKQHNLCGSGDTESLLHTLFMMTVQKHTEKQTGFRILSEIKACCGSHSLRFSIPGRGSVTPCTLIKRLLRWTVNKDYTQGSVQSLKLGPVNNFRKLSLLYPSFYIFLSTSYPASDWISNWSWSLASVVGVVILWTNARKHQIVVLNGCTLWQSVMLLLI